MTPAAAAHRLACSVALGGCLGILYGFLRPPGRKHRHLTDLVFLGFSLWVWLFICFAVLWD